MADSQLITGLASAGAIVIASAFGIVGRRRGNTDEANEKQAVSLTKQLMSDQRRDLDRCRRRVGQLEAETQRLRAERDQYREELDYAHARIVQLGGP